MPVPPTDHVHSEPARPLHVLKGRRPSFLAGVGSLLDIGGGMATVDISTRHVVLLQPEQVVEDAWLLVGQSLRTVLPPADDQVADDG